MRSVRAARILCAACAAAIMSITWAGTPASAQYITIYGGPIGSGETSTTPACPSATSPRSGPRRHLGGRAVRWDASGMTELGHLGTDASGSTHSTAGSINNAGTAVGWGVRRSM